MKRLESLRADQAEMAAAVKDSDLIRAEAAERREIAGTLRRLRQALTALTRAQVGDDESVSGYHGQCGVR